MRTPLVLRTSLARLRSVLGIVLVSADFPQVRFERLLAARGVALGEERCLVLVDLHEVFLTQTHCVADCGEACASEQFVARRVGRTLCLTADVDAVTFIARGCRYAVGSQKHFATRVLTALARFGECSGYTIDTGTPYYFSHR